MWVVLFSGYLKDREGVEEKRRPRVPYFLVVNLRYRRTASNTNNASAATINFQAGSSPHKGCRHNQQQHAKNKKTDLANQKFIAPAAAIP